jgi:signal transduction histidine kinase
VGHDGERNTALVATEGVMERTLDDLRGLEHDVLHQVSTIAVLAELLGVPDLPESQRQLRVRQLKREIRWLRRLVRAERRRLLQGCAAARPSHEVRVDLLVAEVVATTRLMTTTRVQLVVEPVAVRVDWIPLGRAVRNLMWNAVDAAGPSGEVSVNVCVEDRAVAVTIDNDACRVASESNGNGIGLDVVREITSALGATLRMESSIAEHRVILRLPLAPADEEKLCVS